MLDKIRQVQEVLILDARLNDEEYVLYNPSTRLICVINKSAYRIWKGVKDGKSLREIIADLRKNFIGVPNNNLLIDAIENIMRQLQDKSMLITSVVSDQNGILANGKKKNNCLSTTTNPFF